MLVWKCKTILFLLMLSLFPCRLIYADYSLGDSHFILPKYAKKISLDFKNAPLAEVLKVFSKQANMNFVAKTDISNLRVTLYLANVPIDEALEYVLSSNDLQATPLPDDNTFAVTKKVDVSTRLVTKVFKLKHASVGTSALKDTFTVSDSADSAASSASSTTETSSFGGIVDAVKMVLSKSGSLVEDSRTNSLVITDTESQMAVIEETIKGLDVAVAQILIEVDMLDISKVTSDLMGVKFGNTISFTGASKSTLFPFNQSQIMGKEGDSFQGPDAPSSSADPAPTTFGPYNMGSIDFSGMNAILNFLKTRSDTKNLARPRILTLNNQKAQIQVSTNEAVGTKTSNFASSSTTSSVEAERTETGVFLTVTPQADLETREILMAVYPKVIQSRVGATFGNVTFKDAEERGTKSFLRVKDGQTIILGGLIRNDDSNTITKVPFLGDIPLLGSLFKHKNGAGTKRELIIFLTPHILDDHEAYDQQFKNFNPQFRWDEVHKAIADIEEKEK